MKFYYLPFIHLTRPSVPVIIIFSAQLMLHIAFVFDEFRMSLNSLWVIWIILHFLQIDVIVRECLKLTVLEARLKIPYTACQEGNILACTNSMVVSVSDTSLENRRNLIAHCCKLDGLQYWSSRLDHAVQIGIVSFLLLSPCLLL